jgi:hypothetical protein
VSRVLNELLQDLSDHRHKGRYDPTSAPERRRLDWRAAICQRCRGDTNRRSLTKQMCPCSPSSAVLAAARSPEARQPRRPRRPGSPRELPRRSLRRNRPRHRRRSLTDPARKARALFLLPRSCYAEFGPVIPSPGIGGDPARLRRAGEGARDGWSRSSRGGGRCRTGCEVRGP